MRSTAATAIRDAARLKSATAAGWVYYRLMAKVNRKRSTQGQLTLRRGKTGWWVRGVPEYYADGGGPYTECGPYATKQEALEDKAGLEKTLQEIAKQGLPRANMGTKHYESLSSKRAGVNHVEETEDLELYPTVEEGAFW